MNRRDDRAGPLFITDSKEGVRLTDKYLIVRCPVRLHGKQRLHIQCVTALPYHHTNARNQRNETWPLFPYFRPQKSASKP